MAKKTFKTFDEYRKNLRKKLRKESKQRLKAISRQSPEEKFSEKRKSKAARGLRILQKGVTKSLYGKKQVSESELKRLREQIKIINARKRLQKLQGKIPQRPLFKPIFRTPEQLAFDRIFKAGDFESPRLEREVNRPFGHADAGNNAALQMEKEINFFGGFGSQGDLTAFSMTGEIDRHSKIIY